MKVEPGDLAAFLVRVNRCRPVAGARDPAPGSNLDLERRVLEEVAEVLFGASWKLAVYGSLRPGRENHHVVEGLDGSWREGFVRGRLHESGWAAGIGYPALAWDPDGERVSVAFLESPDLPGSWPRIDAFEGEGYRRILVPVWDEGGPVAVANLYAVAGEREEPAP